jgi:hypothetical protein
VLRCAFTAAAIAWAVALPVAAWVAARPDASTLYACAFGIYAAGSIVCHQVAGRSFYLWGVQMPVCARCTGIYVGGALAAIVWYAVCGINRITGRLKADTTYGTAVRPIVVSTHVKRVLVFAAIPTAATLIFEWTAGQMPANWMRALAGFPLGAAVVWVIASDIN